MNRFPTRSAVILTAIQVETAAVLRHIEDWREELQGSSLFYVGHFSADGGNWRVAVSQMGAGNVTAAALTERAIAEYEPEVALFAGIAGGIKDVKIGDVVVGSGVYHYESGKAGEDHFLVRPRELRGSPTLASVAGGLQQRDHWKARLRTQSQGNGRKIVSGRIAAGEKLVAAAESELCRFLRRHYNDAVAVEMEGYGFLEAVSQNEDVRGLVVRGISDLLDNKAATDADGGQDVAADSAAAVAFEILSRYAALVPTGATPKTGLSHATEIPATPAIEVGVAAPNRFFWDGALSIEEAGRLWEDPPPVGALRIAVPWSGGSAKLRRALLRLLCHVRWNALHVEAMDRDAWYGGYMSCLKEHLPINPSGGNGSGLQAMAGTAPTPSSVPPGLPADDLAGQIEEALDEWSFNRLDEGVRSCLSRSPSATGCGIDVEETLGERLLDVWDAWKEGMDPAIRRRFFEMLVSFIDGECQPHGWIGIGPLTMDHCMVPATILALTVADCGNAILHPQGDGPLKPHCGVPGNLASQTVFGHCSGVRRVKGKPIAHQIDKLSQFPWRSRLVVLSGLESSLALQFATARLIGQRPSDGRLNDLSLARPVALAFESGFADALSDGRDAVERYLSQAFRELWNEQANYLKNLAPPVPTEAALHD